MLLVNAKFGAANANTLENVHDHCVKLNIINRTSQTIMSKVTGATMIGLTTRATHLSIIKNTHAWVKQSSDFWFISFVCRLRRNFHHGTALNFIRRENTELDANDGLNIRSSLMETGWHSVLDIETVV